MYLHLKLLHFQCPLLHFQLIKAIHLRLHTKPVKAKNCGTDCPINFYEPKGKGSEAYMDLAIEFVKNNRPHEPKKTRARSKSAPEPAPVKNALED